MDFDFDYGPDYGSGPKFDFDAGSLPTPAGSRLPGDPYANLPVLKQSSPGTKRIMQAVYKGMASGGGGTLGDMTPSQRQEQLNASGAGGGLANVAMTLMGRVPAFADGGFRRHGMPAMVGEEGPELLYPGQGGDMVVPLGSWRGMPPPPRVAAPGGNKTIDSVALGGVLKAFSSQQLWTLGDQVAWARERAVAEEPLLAGFYDALVELVLAENRRRRDEGLETLEEWLATDEAKV